MMTDNGICTVINIDTGKIFAKKEGIIQILDDLANNKKHDHIQSATGSGLKNAMQILLKTPTQHIPGISYTGHFKVSFNDELNYFNNMETGVDIIVGYETTITLTPIKHSTTDDFNNLDIEDRKCRLPNEKTDSKSMFKSYTKNGCQLECSILKTSQAMNCTPWNFPIPDDFATFPICINDQAESFQSQRTEFVTDCYCQDDCIGITYQIEKSDTPLRTQKYCNNEAFLFSYSDLQTRIEAETLYRTFKDREYRKRFFSNHSDSLLIKDCEENLKSQFAVLKVVLGSPRITETQKDVKNILSFPERLGIIGNY